MSIPDPGPESSPIRIVEATIEPAQWDAWRAHAETVSRRAHRVAVVVAVVVAVAAATAGLELLPSAARMSVVIYTPVAGAAVWAATRRTVSRRGLAAVVGQVRAVVVPALVDHIDDAALVILVRQGGTLVTARSTTIVQERRASSVALVASEYEMSSFPAASFPTGGFGP